MINGIQMYIVIGINGVIYLDFIFIIYLMFINGCIIWYVYHHWDLMVLIIDQWISGAILYLQGNDINGVFEFAIIGT